MGYGTRGWRLEEGLEAGEFARPENAVIVEPLVNGAKRLGVETVIAVAADAMFLDEARAAEQAEMFGDSRARDGEGAGDLAGGLLAAAEQVEDGAAGGVGEGAEDGVGGMRNGKVSHNA